MDCSSSWPAAFTAVGVVWAIGWTFVSLARIAIADSGSNPRDDH